MPLPVGPVTRIMPCGATGTLRSARRFSRRQPELVERQDRLLGVQQPDDDLLAELGRHRRHAEVDAPSLEPQAAAAVLRHAALGDVHAGHDLEAGDRRVLQMVRRTVRTSRSRPSTRWRTCSRRLVRLDVDVAGAGLGGVAQDEVDELDDRRQPDVLGERRRVDQLVFPVGADSTSPTGLTVASMS